MSVPKEKIAGAASVQDNGSQGSEYARNPGVSDMTS
jgi:hypothetical protein